MSPVLEANIYIIDDALTGSEFLTSAKEFEKVLIELLKCHDMALHKWCSNNSKLAVSTFFESRKAEALEVVSRTTSPFETYTIFLTV